jgi:hypothetical protein
MVFNSFFMLLYGLLFGLFLYFMHATGRPFPTQISGMDFLLLCLATFRITELITCDSITRFMREPFIRRAKVRQADGTVEEEVQPAGSGFRKAVGELVVCSWCIGVWVGTLLAYFYLWAPRPARVLLLAVSAAAGGIILQLFAKVLDKASDPPGKPHEPKNP